ncbi:CRTAC1 family protein [Occallatibacter riparius]|uniref:CRTAC1 family protein n=2 Tax=Occallatibacter riparius TaxID=1002689 RepID=A0A9J7BVU4_9BACT|nr:CRTAC1 family protein [Occallatibacter riparius]
MSAPQSGIAGGIGAPAQYDEQKRPITAGGFAKPGEAPVVFQDVTKAAGLSTWIHKMGVPEKKFIVETNGSGVCLIDYNNDGWLDIYLVNGASFDSLDGKEPAPHAALFRNNHDGTFTDVSKEAGVQNDRWGYGCSVADYDNDGWPDLYVGNYGLGRLYHNDHDGKFTDVAPKLGVALDNWHPGSTWGDYDGDGRLDLYVTGYVHFDRDNLPIAGTKAVGYAQCQYRGAAVNCGPRGLQGEGDHLFHQNADGTFTDVTAKAGVEDKDRYYGFATIFVDVNNDGKPDLVVGNDSEPNYLYINKGDGTFDDQSYVSGFALNKDGREIASMGIAAGDYENKGLISFYVTDFGDDYKVLFHNDGDASFTDVSYKVGVAQPTIPFVGWGDGFLDYDNDGWLDLFEVNGHVYPEVDQHDWGTTFAERPLLFHNIPDPNGKDRKFEYIKPVEGTGLADVIAARGAAFGDLFNDGKFDVIINPIDGPPALLRNVNADKHHWVEMKLIGNGKSPKDATTATVYLKANGLRMRQDVLSSGSYISANDPRPHFGLGDATDAGTAEIHWPSGKVESIKLPAVDQIYTIEEGAGITAAMCSGKPCPDFKSVKPEVPAAK